MSQSSSLYCYYTGAGTGQPFEKCKLISVAGGTSAAQEKLSQFSVDGIAINNLPVFAAYPQGANNAAQGRTGVWYSAPYYNTTVDDVSVLQFPLVWCRTLPS